MRGRVENVGTDHQRLEALMCLARIAKWRREFWARRLQLVDDPHPKQMLEIQRKLFVIQKRVEALTPHTRDPLHNRRKGDR